MAAGVTNAAPMGGGNYDVAWLNYIWNKDDTFPFVFQRGMTWGQYIDSEYRLYYDDTYQFGFAPNGNRVIFHYPGGSKVVSDEAYHMVQQNEQIVSGYHYILMA